MTNSIIAASNNQGNRTVQTGNSYYDQQYSNVINTTDTGGTTTNIASKYNYDSYLGGNSSNPNAPVATNPIDATNSNPRLMKILNNTELVDLYEKKLAGKLSDTEKDRLSELIKDTDLGNTAINTYIKFKRDVYEYMSEQTGDKFTEAWAKLDTLPPGIKAQLVDDLVEELKKNNVTGIDENTILQFNAETLKNNPRQLEAISKAFKNMAVNEEFKTQLDQNEEVGSTQSIVSKAALGGVLLAAASFIPGVNVGVWGALAIGAGTGALIGMAKEGADGDSDFNNGSEKFFAGVGEGIADFGKGVVA